MATIAVSPCVYSPKTGTETNGGKKQNYIEGLKAEKFWKKGQGQVFCLHVFKIMAKWKET